MSLSLPLHQLSWQKEPISAANPAAPSPTASRSSPGCGFARGLGLCCWLGRGMEQEGCWAARMENALALPRFAPNGDGEMESRGVLFPSMSFPGPVTRPGSLFPCAEHFSFSQSLVVVTHERSLSCPGAVPGAAVTSLLLSPLCICSRSQN